MWPTAGLSKQSCICFRRIPHSVHHIADILRRTALHPRDFMGSACQRRGLGNVQDLPHLQGRRNSGRCYGILAEHLLHRRTQLGNGVPGAVTTNRLQRTVAQLRQSVSVEQDLGL